MSSHTETRPFGCDECEKTFTSKLHLDRHVGVHHKEQPFACSLCSKRFSHSVWLKSHMWTHSQANPATGDCISIVQAETNKSSLYECKTCKQQFESAPYLEIHMLSYNDCNPLKCHFCHKVFKWKHELDKHVKTHPEFSKILANCSAGSTLEGGNAFEKPVHNPQAINENDIEFREPPTDTLDTGSCVSTKHTASVGDMTAAGDGNIFMYSCDSCQQEFTSKEYLEIHQLNLNCCNPLMCKICQKIFRTKSELNYHKRYYAHFTPKSSTQESPSFRKSTARSADSAEVGTSCDTPPLEIVDFLTNISNPTHTIKTEAQESCRIKTEPVEIENESNQLSISCNLCLHQFSSISELERHAATHTAYTAENNTISINTVKSEYEDVCTKSPMRDLYVKTESTFAETGHCSNDLTKPVSFDALIEQGMPAQIEGTSSTPTFKKPFPTVSEILSQSDVGQQFIKINKKYTCLICHKKYPLLNTMKHHMLTHIDTKVYECAVCYKRFRYSHNLATHKLIHSGVKKYSCGICSETFSRNEALKRHMAKHSAISRAAHHDDQCCIEQYLQIMDQTPKQETRDDTAYHRKPSSDNDVKSTTDVYHGEDVITGCDRIIVKNNISSETVLTLDAANIKIERAGDIHDSIACTDNVPTERSPQQSSHHPTFPPSKDAHASLFTEDNDAQQELPGLVIIPTSNENEGTKPILSASDVLSKSSVDHQYRTYNRKFECLICHKKFPRLHTIKQHMFIHIDKKMFKCDVCNKDFRYDHNLATHKSTHTGVKKYSCEVCNQSFARDSTLKRHMIVHSDSRKNRRRPGSVYDTKRVKQELASGVQLVPQENVTADDDKCTIQPGSKPGANYVELDAQKVSKRRHRSSSCKRDPNETLTVNEVLSLSTVSEKYHKISSKEFQCLVCRKKFQLLGTMKQHMLVHMDKKMYNCDVCNKDFRYLHNLVTHKRIHSGLKQYSCSICAKSFAQKWSLRIHMTVHSNVKPYSCNTCGKKFRLGHNLRKHELIHKRSPNKRKRQWLKNETNLQVGTAGKDSRAQPITAHNADANINSDHISQNMQTNTLQDDSVIKKTSMKSVPAQPDICTKYHKVGRGEYECLICEKRFYQHNTVKQHMFVHMDKKMHHCDVCNKHFTYSHNLVTHKLTHTGEKKFSCEICHNRFTKRTSLKRHMVVHSVVKPFVCPVCNMTFNAQENLRRHEVTHLLKEAESAVASRPNKQNKQKRKDGLTVNEILAQSPGSMRYHKLDNGHFECLVCKKIFQLHSTAKQHMLIHMDIKMYKCGDCDKEFRFASNLRHHKLVHLPKKNKSLVCEVCGKSVNKSAFNRHLLSHGRTESHDRTTEHLNETTKSDNMVSAYEHPSHKDNQSHEVDNPTPQSNPADVEYNDSAPTNDLSTSIDVPTHDVDNNEQRCTNNSSNNQLNRGNEQLEQQDTHDNEPALNEGARDNIPLSDETKTTYVHLYCAGDRQLSGINERSNSNAPTSISRSFIGGTVKSEPSYNICAIDTESSKSDTRNHEPSCHNLPDTNETLHINKIDNSEPSFVSNIGIHETPLKYYFDDSNQSNGDHADAVKATSISADKLGSTEPTSTIGGVPGTPKTSTDSVRKDSLTVNEVLAQSPGSMKYHKLSSGEFECLVCQKQFRLLSLVKQHMLVHIDTKMFRCNFCDKTFRYATNLKSHESIHSDIKSHTCEICSKSFKQKSSLNRHVLSHKTTEVLKCVICSEKFNSSALLDRHALSHEEVPSYTCGICSNVFYSMSSFQKHKLSHTLGKVKECGTCGKLFTSKLKLKTHMSRHTDKAKI